MPGRSRISAGLLLYRWTDDRLEVLIAHPGGPFFAARDDDVWSIPKGEVAPGETLEAVAAREFEEETGHRPPDGRWLPLGSIVQKGGKTVWAWALEGDLDPAAAHSNTFELEWPPGSRRTLAVPEIDRVAWFPTVAARPHLKAAQGAFLDRLETLLIGGTEDAPRP